MGAATLLPGLRLAIGVNAVVAIGAAILIVLFLHLPGAQGTAEAASVERS